MRRVEIDRAALKLTPIVDPTDGPCSMEALSFRTQTIEVGER
jgi:hypothetical protein